MKLKICGMRDPVNLLDVSALQPDYLGFIFYPQSVRFVASLPVSLLEDIRKKGIKTVAVFVNATVETIKQQVDRYGFDGVQLHGSESPEDCLYFKRKGLTVFKAVSVADMTDLEQAKRFEGCCDYLLFDTKTSGFGGSGRSFDWTLLEQYTGSTPFFLSGGIGPQDADAILAFRHPKMVGIDINSRFESTPGIKEAGLIRTFLEGIHRIKTLNEDTL